MKKKSHTAHVRVRESIFFSKMEVYLGLKIWNPQDNTTRDEISKKLTQNQNHTMIVLFWLCSSSLKGSFRVI